MANNICDCPIPPGGRAVCEPDQLAICRIKDGKPETQCLSAPAPLGQQLSAREYLDWALSEITGEARLSGQQDFSSSEIAMLEQGVYADSAGAITNFRIPSSVLEQFAQEKAQQDLQPNRVKETNRGRSGVG